MIMAGEEYRHEIPFKHVYFTGIVRDKLGRKMSKSLGNSPDPIELINKFGADGVRMGMLLTAPAGNDIPFDESICEQGRNFSNKIWNALRLVKGWETSDELKQSNENAVSVQWMEMRMACVLEEIEKDFSEFRLSEALMKSYKLVWDDFCSWYLEMVKPAYGTPIDNETLEATLNIFERLMCILHPFMPFVTEEVAHQLGYLKDGETIMLQEYPKSAAKPLCGKGEKCDCEKIYDFVNAKREAITALRALRAEYKVTPATFVKVTIATDNAKAKDEAESLKKAMRAESVEFVAAGSDLPMPSKITKFGTVYLSLEGLVDKAAESKRIAGELAKLAGFIKSSEAKLANKAFVDHAPAAIVDEAKRKLAENKEKVAQLEKLAKLFA